MSDLEYWKDGTRLIEECLAKARRADPGDVPFPLVGDQARLWHSAQVAAYQHALEMMGYVEDARSALLLKELFERNGLRSVEVRGNTLSIPMVNGKQVTVKVIEEK